jgi:hypothetical protein
MVADEAERYVSFGRFAGKVSMGINPQWSSDYGQLYIGLASWANAGRPCGLALVWGRSCFSHTVVSRKYAA